jgi:iron-sulfur cluster repair protein YtfE (RIC family)
MATTYRTSTNDGNSNLLAGAVGFGLGLAASAGRKAAVQAITVAAGDWFEGLKAEHKLAAGIIAALEKTTEAEPKKRAALLLSLQHALGKHAVQEEDVIYCALRASGDVADADMLGQQHNAQVKQGLYDLEQIDKTSPAWLARLEQLKADIEHHVREEEDVIFPRLRDKLSAEENKKLTGRMNREGFKVA